MKVDILGQYPMEGGRTRLIARYPDGKYSLGVLVAGKNAAGEDVQLFDRITPAMSFDDIARCADNIITGEPRASTWPDAMLAIAMGYAAIRAEIEFQKQPAGGERAAPATAAAASVPSGEGAVADAATHPKTAPEGDVS